MTVKIPTSLILHEWSNKLDYYQVTETLNLVFFYKKDPTRVPKKFHKEIDSWLGDNNLDRFIKYKQEAEKHQAIMDHYNEEHRKITDQ